MLEKETYDPVTAPVPGVDEAQRQIEMKEFCGFGDPEFQNLPLKEKKNVLFQKIVSLFRRYLQ